MWVTFDEAGIPSRLDGSSDVVIIAGKSRSLDSLSKLAGKLLKTDGIAFAITNGLGHAERLSSELGIHRVVYASTTHGANIPIQSSVEWAGKGQLNLAVSTTGEILLLSAGVDIEIDILNDLPPDISFVSLIALATIPGAVI